MVRGGSGKSILKEGRNYWKREKADRVSFLIDADSYFSNLYSAMKQAEQSIIIVGWDFHSKVNLVRNRENAEEPFELGPFLVWLVSEKPQLHIYMIIWHFTSMYMLGREKFPVFKSDWDGNNNIHLKIDGKHPPGACRHEKIVVIDDRLAFTGGIDLTEFRWDTSEHKSWNKQRVDFSGNRYGPIHDVQVLVDGAAAGSMGELARNRWYRLTGEEIPGPFPGRRPLWPENLTPDLENVDVAISRTRPAYLDQKEIREVENLYLDSIRSAKKYVYIENQYISCDRIVRAILEMLRKRKGPEFVIIISERYSSWLEEISIRVIQNNLLCRLRDHDRFDRLRIYYPATNGDPGESIKVHSKLIIVDNRLIRLGSSNLTNRSMGVDSECDIAIESAGKRGVNEEICNIRSRFLAEHMGIAPGEAFRCNPVSDSLIDVIGRLNTPGRRHLEHFETNCSEFSRNIYPPDPLFDPVESVEISKIVGDFTPEEKDSKKSAYRVLFIFLFIWVLGLGLGWYWSSPGSGITVEDITGFFTRIASNQAAPFFIMAFYILGGLVMFPVTLMILSTSFFFDPYTSFIYALSGSLLSSTISYWVGYIVGRDAIRKYFGARIKKVSKKLMAHGILAVTSVRLIPVAPFTVVNFAAGASRIRFRDFIFGTIIGMTPGILVIVFFSARIREAVKNPGIASFSVLIAFAVMIFLLFYFLKRRFSRKKNV